MSRVLGLLLLVALVGVANCQLLKRQLSPVSPAGGSVTAAGTVEVPANMTREEGERLLKTLLELEFGEVKWTQDPATEEASEVLASVVKGDDIEGMEKRNYHVSKGIVHTLWKTPANLTATDDGAADEQASTRCRCGWQQVCGCCGCRWQYQCWGCCGCCCSCGWC
ncbi:unnamed protein product [Vitrella brassicaformis CCMP3155]|uniref:Uncharacterized protein n=1 Tax=Vitrella brassicaformis (strain CCMP3155) TaxID=1169540 RepID=A0A0G4EA65_VITBC|nr:unnamed protein product [Vitrella brassicaformis CCMP3155]|mmetsp:Transcript_28816/g.83197  ORF Transcript_28816/g.83197 Transcript_28816/m.83197 type:complete len:166 (+) Transcript_28816:216-713(+)|eukprot:CEL92131.1 unnamed protein product [Vitrella brassicaformis CCMP3155]